LVVVHGESDGGGTEVVVRVGDCEGVVAVVEHFAVVALFEAEVGVAFFGDVADLPGGEVGCHQASNAVVVGAPVVVLICHATNTRNVPVIQ